MTFALRSKEPIAKGLVRSIGSDIKRALRELDSLNAEETIHELRKRLKRMRALIRLVRHDIGSKAFRLIDDRLQHSAKQLTDLRDAEVLVQTVDELKNDRGVRIGPNAFQRLREQLVTRHNTAMVDLIQHHDRVCIIRKCLKKARRDIRQWILGSGWPLIKHGIMATYEKSQNCQIEAIADPSIENLHSWRKEMKYLWHQIQFIRPLHARRISPLEKSLHDLARTLGDDHDLAILSRAFIDNNDSDLSDFTRTFAAATRKKRLKLQERAIKLGRKIFKQSSERFERRLRTGKTNVA
jgi:CHAD domain-containing protein